MQAASAQVSAPPRQQLDPCVPAAALPPQYQSLPAADPLDSTSKQSCREFAVY